MKKQDELINEQVSRRAEALYATEGWVERLEDEVATDHDADLDLLLKNSESDRALFESLKKTRMIVKKSDDVALPESGQYYDELHTKIMAAIDADIAEAATPATIGHRIVDVPVQILKNSKRSFSWPTVFGTVGMTMMLALISIMTFKSNPSMDSGASRTGAVAALETLEVDQRFERRLAMVDPRIGAAVAHELGSFESEEDFLTETAAARLKRVSAGEATAMLETLSF